MSARAEKLIAILFGATLLLGCTAGGENARSFRYISMQSPEYEQAPKSIRVPKVEIEGSRIEKNIMRELEIQQDIPFEYSEALFYDGKCDYDIFEAVGFPDTLIGLSEECSDILVITR